MRRLTVIVMLLMASVPVGRAADWADSKDAAKNPAYAASRAICMKLKGVVPPAADMPTPLDAASLADCSSETLYFGIGRSIDPKAARLCAFVEKKNADPQVENFGFTGDRTLMMVYANGLGVDRNLDVATALACRIDGAPAEIDGRVKHLAELKAKRWTGHDFSLCDDVTSGLMTGVCADHDQRVAKAGRDAALAKLTAQWTPDQRNLLGPLVKAAAAFADARGENEVDQSGSLRAAFVVGAEEKQDKSFAALLDDVVAGKLAPASAVDLAAADAALNMKYRDVIRRSQTLFADSTVTTAGVASSEKAWIRYRDAWLAFAKARYPALSADALTMRLTHERTAQLGDVPAAEN